MYCSDIWTTLIAGGTQSTSAVRTPGSNSPVEDVTSGSITCGLGPRGASETVTVAAGSSVGFKLDNTLYHTGPASIYLGQVPSGQTAASWNGSGAQWFKIAEWGAQFNPFKFSADGQSQLSTTLPSNIPAGEVSQLEFAIQMEWVLIYI